MTDFKSKKDNDASTCSGMVIRDGESRGYAGSNPAALALTLTTLEKELERAKEIMGNLLFAARGHFLFLETEEYDSVVQAAIDFCGRNHDCF